MRDQQPIEVTPLDRREAARAGEVLGRAFQADPLWVATIRDANRRPGALARMFTGLVNVTMAARGLVERTPRLEGIALWIPPGRGIGPWATVRSGFALPRFVMSLPKDERMRMLAVLAQVENRRKALMPEPHWYVSAVGVDPVHQGKAFGSALIGHGISRADRSGTPISLETEVQDNVGFYQGHGFEVLEVLELDGIDIPMWLMARSAD